MNKNNPISRISDRIRNDLQSIFKKFMSVRSAYIFGSTAEGFDRPGSDVDIAIRLDQTLPADRRYDLMLAMIDELENCLGLTVDIVIINTASLKLIRQILTKGQPVFIRDAEEETSFRIRKQKEYFDFRYYMDRDIDEMKRYFGAADHDRS